MSTRSLCLSLSLVASLGAIGISPATAGSEPALPSRAVSPFPIDTTELAEQLCGEEDPEGGKKPNVECHAFVKYVKSGPAAPNALRLTSAEPVSTPCGLWDALLTLDPVRLRPVSGDVSRSTSKEAAPGVSAMVLEMSTRLRFAHQETGRIVDFALRPGRGTGSWSLSRIGGSPDPVRLAVEGSDDGTLTFEGCIPADIYNDPNYYFDPEEQCEVCPEEDPSDEETGGDSVDSAMVSMSSES